MSLKTRFHNWKVLKRAGITLLWEPFMIDAALSIGKRIKSLSEVIDNEIFMQEVSRRSKSTNKYPEFGWSKEEIHEATRSGLFFKNFIARATSQVIAKMNLHRVNAQLLEEISSVLLDEIASAVHEFRPGETVDGVDRTWGYEAYIQNYSLKSACTGVKKTMTSPLPPRGKRTTQISIDGSELSPELGNLQFLESHHPALFASLPRLANELGEEGCGTLVSAAVAETLKGRPEAPVYYWHAVKGKTIRETSKILSISRGKCHRMAERAALKVWQNLSNRVQEMGIG